MFVKTCLLLKTFFRDYDKPLRLYSIPIGNSK